mmetsp:Transcript_2413/g.6058  ORF Transcript_2413/g.6058 Transcript_2413/m.6058 type:complete len:235 (-) Transcript_2413:1329-2033(-)
MSLATAAWVLTVASSALAVHCAHICFISETSSGRPAASSSASCFDPAALTSSSACTSSSPSSAAASGSTAAATQASSPSSAAGAGSTTAAGDGGCGSPPSSELPSPATASCSSTAAGSSTTGRDSTTLSIGGAGAGGGTTGSVTSSRCLALSNLALARLSSTLCASRFSSLNLPGMHKLMLFFSSSSSIPAADVQPGNSTRSTSSLGTPAPTSMPRPASPHAAARSADPRSTTW